MKPTYLWFDTETTGLDIPRSALLEVGAAIVSSDFQVISTFERVLYFDLDDHNAHLAPLDPVVRGMHTVNGLWSACAQSKLLPVEVDHQLAVWTGAFFRRGEPVLAGRCVDFDREVAKLHLPKFHGLLNYHSFDTYAVSCLADHLGLKMPASEHPHRALGDVKGDISTVREFLVQVRHGDGRARDLDDTDSWWTL